MPWQQLYLVHLVVREVLTIYKQKKIIKKRGYEVIVKRIPATFGFVILDSDKVTIGTGVDRSLDVVLPIYKRKMQVQSSELNGDTLQKLIDFKGDLLKPNDYISGKRRQNILYIFFFVKTCMHKHISPHGDYDYMGEAINLVENFKVEKVIFNCGNTMIQKKN